MKHAPSHPRFQEAASVWAAVKQKLFSKAVFFQRLSTFSAGLFFKDSLFLLPVCLFLQKLSIFSAGLFFKASLFFLPVCLFFKNSPSFQQVFFSKTLLSIFSAICLFLKDFFLTCLFFQRCFFAKDKQSNTGRTTRKVLVGQPVLLSLSIAKVYF